MKARYPESEDWYRVRFSNEVHFLVTDLKDNYRSYKKPGTSYCFDCLQQSAPPPNEEKDRNRKHCGIGSGGIQL